MPLDRDALAESVAKLEGVDPADAGLDAALQLVAREADDLFPVDGSGVMLLSEGNALRYVAASDEQGKLLEALQEDTQEGPCVDAFYHDRPVLAPDLTADPRWPSVGPLASGHGIRAVLGVPIGLTKGPVGTRAARLRRGRARRHPGLRQGGRLAAAPPRPLNPDAPGRGRPPGHRRRAPDRLKG